MTFQLMHKGDTAVNAVFHVVDSAGTTVGSINVPHGQEDDLQKCWRGAVPSAATAATAGKQARAANAMVAALKRGPRMTKAAVLRGC